MRQLLYHHQAGKGVAGACDYHLRRAGSDEVGCNYN